MSKPFRRGFFSRIKLSIGAPIAPGDATPAALQAAIAQLRERP